MKEPFIHLDFQTKKFIQDTLDVNDAKKMDEILYLLYKQGFSRLQVAFILYENARIPIHECNRIILNSALIDNSENPRRLEGS